MERRDRIILQKVLSEIDIAQDMMSGCSLEDFKRNEMLMRAVSMTVINIGELVKNLSVLRAYPMERDCGLSRHRGAQVSDIADGRRVRNRRDGFFGAAETNRGYSLAGALHWQGPCAVYEGCISSTCFSKAR